MMPSSTPETVDLLDLKLLPAWVKESSASKSYEDYEGEGEERPRGRGGPRDRRERSRKRPTFNVQPPTFKSGKTHRPRKERQGRDRRPHRAEDRPQHDRTDRDQNLRSAPPQITVRFLPHPGAFENVAAQIKSGSVAYSLFSLARLFLEKPERYSVCLTANPEFSLYQLGDNGTVSGDRQFLETNAFSLAKEDFYKVDITQTEPIKGNFTSVARCRLSGTLLGPTNHHNYQPRLRTLYEQRFSRRMSFAEYQRQIELVSDPAVVERWKEEARTVRTFTTLREEPPLTFGSPAEAERHFRQNYLPGLVRAHQELTIDGVTSRHLPDRGLRRVIENAWSTETRSPTHVMQELSKQFREEWALQIFRHRRGMIFVSPIRVRVLAHDQTSVSPPVKAILEALAANPGINRKELAEKVIVDLTGETAEPRKLALASDLHWLISEGYVIEFNDGSLDLPRAKKTQVPGVDKKPEVAAEDDIVAAVVPTAESIEQTPAAPGASIPSG
jgi:hypothetical protein